MKIFWFILSLFMLFLSVSPCCDDEGCQDNTGVNHATIRQDQDSHSEHNEPCSPFCSCSSCQNAGACFSAFTLIVTQEFVEQTDLKIHPYTFQFASNFEANIWQPPQLG